jgi:hypothetical protein
MVEALNQGSNNSYDQYAEIAYTVNAVPLTGVSLQASPASPAYVGTPVTLTATPAGGTAVQYKFWACDPSTGSWNVVQAYSTAATCDWAPSVAGTWYLQVWALNEGSNNTYDQYAELTFTVTVVPLTGVSLSANPSSASAGTQVTLTATPAGGTAVEYEFWAYNPSTGVWSDVQPYSTSATCLWTPSVAGTWSLQVWALNQGSENNYDQYAEISFPVSS